MITKKIKYFFFNLGLIIALITTHINNVSAQNTIAISDTRDLNDLPGDAILKVKFDFKTRNIVSVPGAGIYSTMMTLAPWGDATGGKHHQLNFNDGGIFYRTGSFGYSTWDGWQKLLMENYMGNVGIGTNSPTEKLAVNGNIRAKEIKVETANWPDYVFAPDYQNISLAELEKYIKVHQHLPDLPSAKEVEMNGVPVGELIKLQQKKIEELTLHLIEKDKEILKLNTAAAKLPEIEKKLQKLAEKVSTLIDN